MDLSHLHALETGLSHERERLAKARRPAEIEQRKVWVRGYEREIAHERAFLGLPAADEVEAMSDDDLLAELLA